MQSLCVFFTFKLVKYLACSLSFKLVKYSICSLSFAAHACVRACVRVQVGALLNAGYEQSSPGPRRVDPTDLPPAGGPKRAQHGGA
eukprot:338062-Chlamydomonas_euryale.AAC.1